MRITHMCSFDDILYVSHLHARKNRLLLFDKEKMEYSENQFLVLPTLALRMRDYICLSELWKVKIAITEIKNEIQS